MENDSTADSHYFEKGVIMEMLMHLSVDHTCTQFVQDLLGSHPQIGEVMIIDSLPSFQIPSLRIDERECAITDTIEQELFNCVEGNPKYVLFRGHVGTGWYLPILFHAPFEFKLVAPMRHPYKSLRTYYLRNKQHYTVMGSYLMLIHALKWNPDNFVLPIDLWGDLPVDERLNKVRPLFQDFLGLPMTPEIEQKVVEWKPRGMPDIPYTRELTEAEISEINRRISNSRVLEKLKEIGFNYEI